MIEDNGSLVGDSSANSIESSFSGAAALPSLEQDLNARGEDICVGILAFGSFKSQPRAEDRSEDIQCCQASSWIASARPLGNEP